MDFDFTSDQELFFESAKEYAEKYFTPELIKQYYEVDHHISLEAAMAFRELGFMHLGLPEEVGGIPCSKLTLVALMENFTSTPAAYFLSRPTSTPSWTLSNSATKSSSKRSWTLLIT